MEEDIRNSDYVLVKHSVLENFRKIKGLRIPGHVKAVRVKYVFDAICHEMLDKKIDIESYILKK